MKDKILTTIKVILFISAAAVFSCGILYLADVTMNGMLAEWFIRRFICTSFDSDAGIWRQEFNWNAMRNLLLTAAVAAAVFWTVSVLIAIHVSKKKTVKKTSTEISRLVKRFLAQEQSTAEIFPEKYGDLSVQMTELKNQIHHNEQILKEESARKNDLIAYLAHDLKTPLTSVIGYLSLLEEAPDMPAEQKAKYVHISLEKALRLETLINEFFDITRYNLHEIVLERENLDLSYMLIQMTDEFYPVLKEHENTVTADVGENLCIHADPDKLARVFNNILKNAVAYSDPGTPIAISAAEENDNVVIRFQNRGKTIPKQKLESIFEKFFRLDDSRAANTGGAGLGLAIAREIVTLHGGSITAESENGLTVFTVAIPVKEQKNKTHS